MFERESKILIVDPLLTQRALIKKMLRKLGFSDFEESKNGSDAWNTLIERKNQETPIQIVLSNWKLPKLDGIDLLKMARTDARLKKLPFIFMSRDSLESRVIEALRWEVTYFLTLPLKIELLNSGLEDAYKRLHANVSTG